jgi:hypothetical protein
VTRQPPPGTRRCAQALLLLYPRAWRQRYRAEMLLLLSQLHVRPRTLLDLIFGAADAHLHPGLVPREELTVTQRIRTSQFVISCATALYGVALLAMQQVRDPLPAWRHAAADYPQLRAGLIAGQLTGGLAVLAGLAGFVGVSAVMVRQAASAGGSLRRAVRRAGLLLLGWFSISAVTAAVTVSRPGTGVRPLRLADLVLEYAWLAATALTAVLAAGLLWRALGAVTLGPAAVRAARAGLAAASVAMAAGLLATLAESGLLLAYQPQLIGAGWLAVIGGAMLAATALAGLAVSRMRQPGPAARVS